MQIQRFIIAVSLTLSAFEMASAIDIQVSKPLGFAWAANSVNAVIFRKNSIASLGDDQWSAFYDAEGFVSVSHRNINSPVWETVRTRYKGDVHDAHRSISLGIDGDGYLHLSWDHHNSPLRYAVSIAPRSASFGPEQPMTGDRETRVTYPEFYRLPSGDLLFFYRNGESGSGDLVLNRYSLKEKKWARVHNVLIDGEGKRNAYPQISVDSHGSIYLSWVWRETWDVSTNHDLCYAKSDDGGITWHDSTGHPYMLPITAASAEYALRIPQGSELINQTSITDDGMGNPVIASYWRLPDSAIPQYHVVFRDTSGWRDSIVTERTQAFSLSGGGTKKIPISRPQIVARTAAGRLEVFMVYRDSERGSKPSLAYTSDLLTSAKWKSIDLSGESTGDWEPSFDIDLWKSRGILDLYVQNVGQGDGEHLEALPPTPVSVLRFIP